MADRSEHVAAFDQIAALLRAGAAANARALQVHRGTSTGAVVERQLEHTLDRLAVLYGRGTFENLNSGELFEAAIDGELRMARELETVAARTSAGSVAAAGHVASARALIDAARLGVRLHVRGGASVVIRRGVYVEPLRPELERSLAERREPYVRWRKGIVVALSEDEVAELRAAGDEVNVLFLDPDEMLDLYGRGDRPATEAELDRRLTIARAAPDRVGDYRDRHRLRMLLYQSIVLRNLRDRLAAEHPAAHRAIQPIVADNRAFLETALAAAPLSRAALADPLAASIDHERELQALVTRMASEPEDPAGMRARFRAVADAGSHIVELEQQYPPGKE